MVAVLVMVEPVAFVSVKTTEAPDTGLPSPTSAVMVTVERGAKELPLTDTETVSGGTTPTVKVAVAEPE